MKIRDRRHFLASGMLGLAAFPINRGAAQAAPGEVSPDSKNRVAQLMRELNLSVLPKESGYLGIIGRSALQIEEAGRRLAAQSQNYYMLTQDRPINYLHWLESDDTHILIEGGPVDYFIFRADGSSEMRTLGMNLAAGHRPVVAVPAGSWKALRLHPDANFALTANVLSPEFTPDRVKIGAGRKWIERFTGKAPWAQAGFLRELIGPNWDGEGTA